MNPHFEIYLTKDGPFKRTQYWQEKMPKINHITTFSMWEFGAGIIYLHEDEIIAKITKIVKKSKLKNGLIVNFKCWKSNYS
jgi:hypothetical protein